MAGADTRHCPGEVRVKFNRLLEHLNPAEHPLAAWSIKRCQSAEIPVVSLEIFGRLPRRPFDFCPLNSWCNDADHTRRHTILQLEYVIQRSFKLACPEVRANRRVDQLTGNSDSAASLATLPSST